jgi:hypothetical protein
MEHATGRGPGEHSKTRTVWKYRYEISIQKTPSEDRRLYEAIIIKIYCILKIN